MKRIPSSPLRNTWAEPQLPGGGCAGCWAAGYCAAYRPLSLQAPAACPLNARPRAPRPASGRGR